MRAEGGKTVTGAQRPGAPDLENASAFLAAAGLRLTHVAADRVEGVIDLGPAHHTPWGVVHGGVYTAAVKAPPASARPPLWPTAAKSRWAPTTTRTSSAR